MKNGYTTDSLFLVKHCMICQYVRNYAVLNKQLLFVSLFMALTKQLFPIVLVIIPLVMDSFWKMGSKVTIASLVISAFLSSLVLFSHLSDRTQFVEQLVMGTAIRIMMQVITVRDYRFTGLQIFTITFTTMLLSGVMPGFGFLRIQD